jgi:hypothetical protein
VNTPMVSRQDLWEQYKISVDLYKHYLKLTIELNVFYYAITGAIISYYAAHVAEAAVRYTLILPIAMSLLFACLFIYGAILNNTSRQELFSIRDALGLSVAPELAVLSWLLRICAGLILIVAAMLTALLLGCIRVA